MELRVTDLAVARGPVPVLSGVSFALSSGTALVLRGANGIGKTTLLRSIAGLQPCLSGQVTGGEDTIAYAGHADGLKSMLTVRENLAFWAQVFGTSNIEPTLESFDLRSLENRLAGTLSAGQKRRLGLARLGVTGRPVWILDEPTVSLDARSVTLFANLVETHLRAGGIALMATHIDLGFDARILDLTPFKAKENTVVHTSDGAFL